MSPSVIGWVHVAICDRVGTCRCLPQGGHMSPSVTGWVHVAVSHRVDNVAVCRRVIK